MLQLLDEKHQNSDVVYRLTALWALSESGIGGFMFALKIPLTGLLLGAISIILLSMIAFYSERKFSEILRATLLVVILKLLVSPHSSPTAYLAVAFQGVAAAIIFSSIKSLKLAAVLLGAITMFESAAQKLLLLTIVFGKELWEAVNIFFNQISKELSLNLDLDYSYWLIGIYLSLFTVWGIIVGVFAASLPAKIEERKHSILPAYYLQLSKSEKVPPQSSNRRASRIWMFISLIIFVLIFLAFTYYFPSKAWWLLGRTLVIIFLFYFVIAPTMRWLANKWLKNRRGEDIMVAKQMMDLLPQLKKDVAISYNISAKHPSFFARAKAFMTNTIIITLYARNAEQHNNI